MTSFNYKQLMLSAIIVFAGVFVLSSCGGDDKPKPVTVTSLSVTEGSVGTTVTVNGTNFDAVVANNKVFFGKKEAEVTGGTTTTLTTKVPAGATTGHVYVQVGTGAKIKGPMFTVKPKPVTVTSLSVNEGSVGTTVTVNGTNFDAVVANNKVFFGEKEAEVTGGTTTTLTTKVPAGAATGHVYVQVGTGAKIKGPMFTVKSSQTVEIEVFVSHSDDDVEELIKNTEPMLWQAGHMYMNSSDLELGRFDVFRLNNQDTHFGYFYIGVRFRNVNLPKGAKIIKASIVFTAKNNDSNTNPPVHMRIHGEYVGNAAEYNKDELKNLSNRTKTRASVLWDIPAWSAGEKGAAQTTVDLKNIVQEIASRTDWAANHAMNFIFTPEGDHVQKDERAGGRRALSFDGTKTQKQRRPVLKIVYEK